MLSSELDKLEPLHSDEDGIRVEVSRDPDSVVGAIEAALACHVMTLNGQL